MYSIEELSEVLEKVLSNLNLPEDPKNLYKPIQYILSSGGKRIRPVLTLAACNLFKETIDQAIYPALAVEVFHNFTLVHDDIMDNADIRRGKETVHKKWNSNIGILAGDAMSIMAYKMLIKTDKQFIVPIIDVFNEFALGICEGQQYDMDFESIKYIDQDDYTRMTELKTAVLLKGALQIGAIIGEAKESDIYEIGQFGKYLGLAFQIQDDLLDAYGDSKVFGKKQGGDIVANKKTILTVKAYSKAKGSTLDALNNLYNSTTIDPELKVSEVIKIFNETNVKEETEQLISNYYVKATESLEKIDVNPSRKEVLIAIAQRIMSRNS
ncbi:MAG: polyprenyl synthetase family protein [Bacteroidales bacterium]|nr:MAG: polyprenyl synthetase family protein [Bacteroidales bacterium]